MPSWQSDASVCAKASARLNSWALSFVLVQADAFQGVTFVVTPVFAAVNAHSSASSAIRLSVGR